MNREDEFGCDLCCREDAEAAWAAKRKHETVLLDDNHFAISIERCAACGQAFVRIFTEFIDWEKGDDPQYWDLLPITESERAALVAQTGEPDLNYLMTLGADRRHLKADDHGLRWAGGGLFIMPGG